MKEIKILQGQGRGPMVKEINEEYAKGWTLVGPAQFAVNFTPVANPAFQNGIVHYLATLEREAPTGQD